MAGTPTGHKPGPSTVRSASVECLGGGVAGGGRHRFDGLGVGWRVRQEGMLVNSVTSMPPICQPGHLD
jgi:hypothetical protein